MSTTINIMTHNHPIIQFSFLHHRKFSANAQVPAQLGTRKLEYIHAALGTFTACYLVRRRPARVCFRAMLKRSVGNGDSFRDEAKILRSAKSSPHVLEFLGLWAFSSQDSIFEALVFEHVSGTLQNEICHRVRSMPAKKTVAAVASQLLNGINFIHMAGIVIRSLTSDSVFLVVGDSRIFVKISDFSHAYELKPLNEFHQNPNYVHWLHSGPDADIAAFCTIVYDFANLVTRRGPVTTSYLLSCRSSIPYYSRFADYLACFNEGEGYKRIVMSAVAFFRSYGWVQYVQEQLAGYTPVIVDYSIGLDEFESVISVFDDSKFETMFNARLLHLGSPRHPICGSGDSESRSQRDVDAGALACFPATREPYAAPIPPPHLFQPVVEPPLQPVIDAQPPPAVEPQFPQLIADSILFQQPPPAVEPEFHQPIVDPILFQPEIGLDFNADPFFGDISAMTDTIPDSVFPELPGSNDAESTINALVASMHAAEAEFACLTPKFEP